MWQSVHIHPLPAWKLGTQRSVEKLIGKNKNLNISLIVLCVVGIFESQCSRTVEGFFLCLGVRLVPRSITCHCV